MKSGKKQKNAAKKSISISERKRGLSGVLTVLLTLLASTALIVVFLYVLAFFAGVPSVVRLFGGGESTVGHEFFNSEWSILVALIALGIFVGAVAILTYFGFGTAPAAASSPKKGKLRFPRLTALDSELEWKKEPEDEPSVSLESLCVDFRNFAAWLGLYYDIEVIRSFIASLCVSRLMIIQGISGTGKTSIAWAFGEFLGNGTNIIPVQPSWKEKTDLIGYYNEFTGKFNETPFLEAMYRSAYSTKVSVTLLDEMNIARVEYYFAEFLSMLEIQDPEKRLIDVISDSRSDDPELIRDGRLRIPDNIWFIGTANRDDSTYTISDKVYDRAMVLQLDRKCEPFQPEETHRVSLGTEQFWNLKKEALEKYPLSDAMASAVSELDSFLAEHLEITFGNRILSQYREFVPYYVACGGREEEATDDFICTKILRKFETKSALVIKRESEGLLFEFDRLFGENSMPHCRKYLARFEK